MAVRSVVSLILRGEDDGATDVLDDTSQATTGLTDSLGTLAGGGAAAVAAVAAVAAGAFALAQQAGQADQELNKLQIRTAATGEELLALEGNIQAVRAAGLGEDFAGAAAAIGTVETVLGATGEELTKVTQQALVLDEVFETGFNETIRTADTLVDQFGGSAEQALDIITAGLQATGDPAEDLLDSLTEYAGNLSQAGFSAREFTDILNDGLQAGARNTDDIADALREFTIRAVDGSEATRRGFALLGLDVDEIAGQLENGALTVADVFDVVQDRLNDAEFATNANEAAIALYGTKAEDVGLQVIASLDRTVVSLGQVEGAAQAATDTFTDGLANTEARLDAVTERAQILAGRSVLPLAAAGLERLVGLGEITLDLGSAVFDLGRLQGEAGEATRALLDLGSAGGQVDEQTGQLTQSFRTANDAARIINQTFREGGTTLTSAAANVEALEQAQLLLKRGFEGTGEELAALSVALAEANQATAEQTVATQENERAQLSEQIAMRGRVLANEQVAATLALVTFADEEQTQAALNAAAATERAAEAEDRRVAALAASNEAIGLLNERIAQGFAQDLGILEAEGELESFNDVLFRTLQESGATAVELATLRVALGDVGEEALAEALKFQIFQEGITRLANAASEDGKITREEIQGIISGAEELQQSLDEEFALALDVDGAEGVLDTAQALVDDLEIVTAQEFGVDLVANAAEAQAEVDAFIDRIGNVEQEVIVPVRAEAAQEGVDLAEFEDKPITVTIDDNSEETVANLDQVAIVAGTLSSVDYPIQLVDNTAETSQNIAGISSQLGELTLGQYNVFVNDNIDDVESEVGALTGALGALNGSTYTFSIVADTSQVPSWAIPQSPLPIAVAWEEFLGMVNNTPLRPVAAGEGSLLPPTLEGGDSLGQLVTDPAQAVGGSQSTLIINGNVIIEDRQSPASQALREFLQDQIVINDNQGF